MSAIREFSGEGKVKRARTSAIREAERIRSAVWQHGKNIKQIGRGYILDAAVAGTGFGGWLSDGLI
ncbi:hypothetical protein [Martelella mediterranea]|uniref:hypothetical protein n=1 Tax=Martelella mediterranea TaxID=293089 RepID=UPI000380F0CD|nr:hypothetical protein [Martelella mediterranea]